MNLKTVIAMATVLIVLVLAACSGAQAATPAASSPTPQPTLPSTSTPIPPPTSTVVVPSATPTPFQELRQTCVNSDAVNQANLAMRGVVVFDNFVPVSFERAIETIYLRDLEKATIKILPPLGEFDDFVGISPNRTKLLYQYWSKDDLRLALTDAGGKPLIDFENGLGKENWRYLNWQDEETLRVVRREGRGILPNIYNPFTQEYKSLRTDWPDVHFGEEPRTWGLDGPAISTGRYKGANIVYDPSITRVVYPKNGEIVSLTDVETGKELARAHFRGWGKVPRWSPDGENLVLIASVKDDSARHSDEFFIVSRDGGEFKRLTYLTNIFEEMTIVKYAWSPNGEQIVFLFNPDTVFNTRYTQPEDIELQSEVALLDIKTGAITTLCFPSISVTVVQSEEIR